MKRIVAALTVLCLLLCGCELNFGGGKKENQTTNNSGNGVGNLTEIMKYTAQEQDIFSNSGVSVTVVAGEYTGIPQFRVKNSGSETVLVALDAVVYNDVFQPGNTGAGNVYEVPAGTDEVLSKCSLLQGTASTSGSIHITIGGSISSGDNNMQFGTTKVGQKREVRFAVYKPNGDMDRKEYPKEENLLYRSELVQLKTSDYDGKPVTKSLPGSQCLYEKDGIRIWWQSTMYTASYEGTVSGSGSIVGSFESIGGSVSGAASGDSITATIGSITGTVKPGSTDSVFAFSSLGGGICVDNGTGKDIRVEFTATSSVKDSKDEKDDKNEIPAVQELYISVPAGKASKQLRYMDGRMANAVGAKTVDVRIYDAASGELIAEAKGLEVKNELKYDKDNSGNNDQTITVKPIG